MSIRIKHWKNQHGDTQHFKRIFVLYWNDDTLNKWISLYSYIIKCINGYFAKSLYVYATNETEWINNNCVRNSVADKQNTVHRLNSLIERHWIEKKTYQLVNKYNI